MLDKLRSINYRLRKRLKDLNEKVERAIDRTDTKRMLAARKKPQFSVEHRMQVKDKEIQNAEQQLESYHHEIESLTAKIEQISQVGVMLEKEQEIREHTQAIYDLKKTVKDKELILENLAKSDDPSYKVSNMINEIRMWKEKIMNREALYEHNESTMQTQSEKLSEIENENEELMKRIQEADAKIDLEPEKAKGAEQDQQMEKVNEEIKVAKEKYEKAREEGEKNLKAEQKEIKELKAERDTLYGKLKELEQERRISNLKLREVGRMLKHNQLNPIMPIRANHNISSKRSDTGSKKTMSKRGSTSNLLGKSKNKGLKGSVKKLGKGPNTKSTQLLNKKQYSKPKDDSDEEFEKNQVIDYEKFKKQQKQKAK